MASREVVTNSPHWLPSDISEGEYWRRSQRKPCQTEPVSCCRFWASERQPLTFSQVIPSPHLLGANSSPWDSRPWRTAAPQQQLKWRLMEWIFQIWVFPLPRRTQRPQVSGFTHPRPPKSRARIFVTCDAFDAERMRMKETFYSSLVFCPSMMSSR